MARISVSNVIPYLGSFQRQGEKKKGWPEVALEIVNGIKGLKRFLDSLRQNTVFNNKIYRSDNAHYVTLLFRIDLFLNPEVRQNRSTDGGLSLGRRSGKLGS